MGSEESFNALVSESVRCTIDGGFTDVTGIANAVAAGATDLVVILNMTDSEVPSGLLKLFSQSTITGHWGWNKRFNLGAGMKTEEERSMFTESAEAQFPIFEKDVSQAQSDYDTLKTKNPLVIPEGNKTQLISMVVGTMEATTRTQPFFGVVGHKVVKLNIIAVNTKLNEGEMVNFHDYSTLVQEIVTTLLSPANQDEVNDTVLPFFFTPAWPTKVSPDATANFKPSHGGA